ncbi:MAG: GAF domain-containing protein [Candidatus Omnitrophica bacterium]|nr:GAF domain-containing protein [Candidatus Omnitrophota bacterium]
MRIDKVYQRELLKKLSRGLDLKREKALFSRLFKHPIFWMLDQPSSLKKGAGNARLLPFVDEKRFCSLVKDKRKLYCRSLIQAVNRAKKSRQLEEFVCSNQSYGLCLPLVQGDALYGFLILCHLKIHPTEQALHLISAWNNTILEKAQKELELAKLYQTIRPRAVALSTIHTIRRLISSTLDLDELLPRIARLSLQVLRAKRCLISLLDEKSKQLLPRAAIDLSCKTIPAWPLRLMKKIEKKLQRSGNIILKKSYLAVPLIDEDLIGIITIAQKTSKAAFNGFDREILTALAEQAVGAIKNAKLYKEQEEILLGTVQSLSALLQIKSAYPYKNLQALMGIVTGIAKELRLSPEALRDLRYASMLHDAERVGIPEDILTKPAQLSGEEFKIIKEHPKTSIKILSPLQRLKPAITIILHHHEKFDGSGYPDKLKGDKIPLGARIMAVADSFMAMISLRPYRKSTTIEEAIREIKKHSATQFDPRVIKAFLNFTKKVAFKKIIVGIYNARTKKDI